MYELIVGYIVLSPMIIFSLAYFLLDQLHYKDKLNYLFVLTILVFTIIVSKDFSTIDTLLLFILFFFLSIKNAGNKNVAYSLLIVSFAYILEIIISELMHPFYIMSFNATRTSEQLFLLLLMVILTLIMIAASSWSIRRWVLPNISSNKKTIIVSYLLTFCLFAYQTYWLLILHTEETPFLRLFILIFHAVLLVLIISIVQAATKNERLKIQTQKQKLEYEMMSTYAMEVKKQYAEMRKFRHDYVNILSTIEYYLEQNNLDELKQFYQSNVKKTKTLFSTNMLRLDDLQKIESLEIRSILTTKLIAAQGKNIDVQIEVSETIPDQQLVDPIIFIRILGILLDNAIEELETLGEGQLVVAVFLKNGDTIFIIQNTAREQIEPIYLLKQADFSTKGDGRGLGLANVDELVALEPRMFLETSITNGCFIQKITITGG